MACESCRLRSARLLTRAALRPSFTPSSTIASSRLHNSVLLASDARHAAPAGLRSFGTSKARRSLLESLGASVREPYRVLGATQKLFKACAAPANYKITEEERKNDEVLKLEDGEEVGKPTTEDNVWHTTFKLPATFSTWSHVTMLHLYLINARVRCFERDTYRNWQQQLIDHFFFECEKKMHLDHGMTSSALRQRYLKDIFVQWRGLLLAYDEGVIKGDAILASAVWRNLFKGSPDVDPRALVAIVGWLRAGLQQMETIKDEDIAFRAEEVLERSVTFYWDTLEGAFSKSEAGAAELAAADEVKVSTKEASARRAAAKRATAS